MSKVIYGRSILEVRRVRGRVGYLVVMRFERVWIEVMEGRVVEDDRKLY